MKENMIKENWESIELIEKEVRAKTGDEKAGFNASTFFLGSNDRFLMIPCLYRTKKGDNFSKSYKEMMIYANYCPFSGKPLYKDIKVNN